VLSQLHRYGCGELQGARDVREPYLLENSREESEHLPPNIQKVDVSASAIPSHTITHHALDLIKKLFLYWVACDISRFSRYFGKNILTSSPERGGPFNFGLRRLTY